METNEIIRVDGRMADQLRPVRMTPNFMKHADGSVLIELGDTHVICAVSMEQRAPTHAKDKAIGWLTAEYDMLPTATSERTQRDRSKGRVSGRSSEIQRLIGRSLRSCVNLDNLVERTLTIDCDVIRADGGTRTAAITGAYAALKLALLKLAEAGRVTNIEKVLTGAVASISVGVVEGRPVLDLCYLEDSQADVDMNVVMDGEGRFIELQGTAESMAFDQEQLNEMLRLAKGGIDQLLELQERMIQTGEPVESTVEVPH